jgi:hypothetical protein
MAVALLVSSTLFLSVYGFMTGLSHGWLQALSTAIKMPLLFLITMAFCLPALYFFALALLGIRLSILQVTTVVLSGIGVTAFLLLGLSPVTLFFVLTSTNYPFFQLLAVIFVSISGFIGLYYLLRGMTWVDRDQKLTMGSVGRALLGAWVLLYGFVGAQMTWRLSPLIGDPEFPFVLLRPSRDNFFVDAIRAFEQTTGVSESALSASDSIGLFFCGGGLAFVGLVVGLWLGSRNRPTRGNSPSSTVPRTGSHSAPTSDQPGGRPPASDETDP